MIREYVLRRAGSYLSLVRNKHTHTRNSRRIKSMWFKKTEFDTLKPNSAGKTKFNAPKTYQARWTPDDIVAVSLILPLLYGFGFFLI